MNYTAIGEQVGMAQRMESVAPPGGVMISESTARLVEHAARLGEPQLVAIKGATDPVPARRLLAVPAEHHQTGRRELRLVGRQREMTDLQERLGRAIGGRGCVVGVRGAPGVGKSVGSMSSAGALVRGDSVDRDRGFELLHLVRETALQHRYIRIAAVSVDLDDASERIRTGDFDGAIELCAVLDYQRRSGEGINRGWPTSVLVDGLLARGRPGDLEAAQTFVDQLAALPTEPVYLYHELPLLRMSALIAKPAAMARPTATTAIVIATGRSPSGSTGTSNSRPRWSRQHRLECLVVAKTYPCERVGLDFIDTAPFRFVSTVDLAISPEQLFEVLADAESWPHWATVITDVVWTSPEPRGVGTTRTVNMRGNIVGDEEYIAWEPFSHMAFRFNESNSNAISAFAEDYRVVETPDGCHLTWVMAMKPSGAAGRIGMMLGQPVMGWLFQRFLHNLRRYTDKRYAPYDPVSTDPPTPSA